MNENICNMCLENTFVTYKLTNMFVCKACIIEMTGNCPSQLITLIKNTNSVQQQQPQNNNNNYNYNYNRIIQQQEDLYKMNTSRP